MTYSSSVARRVVALVLGLLVTAVLAVIAPYVLREFGGINRLDRELLLGSVIVVAAIGVILTVRHVFFSGPVTIRTTPTEVEVVRAGKVREHWARADALFSSFVVRQSTNGIRTGSVRKLVVVTATERVEIVCTWFSAQTFNALIADVAPLVPVTDHATRPVAHSVAPTTFTIHRSRTRLAVRLGAIGVALIVLAVVTGFLIAEIDASLPAVPLVALSAIVLFAVIAAPLVRAERVIPRQLTVSQSTLQFDDRVFPVGQLSAIRATPPGYVGERRSIVVTDTTGRTTVIPLGRGNDKSFPDYGDFVEAVRQATAHRPGILTLAVA